MEGLDGEGDISRAGKSRRYLPARREASAQITVVVCVYKCLHITFAAYSACI